MNDKAHKDYFNGIGNNSRGNYTVTDIGGLSKPYKVAW